MTLFMPSRWAIHYFPEVTSTQDVAKQLIAEGASGFFVVRADHQTSGRGRAGRGWSSLSGNLQATFSVPMTFDVALAANYSFVAAVALSQTVLEFVGEECCIEHKWPNDVWINGKKLAGILLEIHEPYLLMGIGLNISHAPEDAAYLNQVLSNDVGVVDFLDRFFGESGCPDGCFGVRWVSCPFRSMAGSGAWVGPSYNGSHASGKFFRCIRWT
jgi:biotin-[acetyl-CoA-carboxylase] ligase BirA-like protein